MYPAKLSLGSLFSNVSYEFVVNVSIPVSCRLSTNIKGLSVTPELLSPGKHEVRMLLSKNWGSRHTAIFGKIILSSQHFIRFIVIDAYVSPDKEIDNRQLDVRKVIS